MKNVVVVVEQTHICVYIYIYVYTHIMYTSAARSPSVRCREPPAAPAARPGTRVAGPDGVGRAPELLFLLLLVLCVLIIVIIIVSSSNSSSTVIDMIVVIRICMITTMCVDMYYTCHYH